MPAPALLFSPLLTEFCIPHAFTTRAGGVSPAPFDSLNFGNPMDLPPHIARDPIANIKGNFRRVLDTIGTPDREVVEVYQIHSNIAKVFHPGQPSRQRRAALAHEPPDEEFDFKADALITADPARMLAVRVADCCPILLATPDGSTVAAVHAGWRGVVSNILDSAVNAMQELTGPAPPRSRGTGVPPVSAPSTCPAPLLAAIGPCIGPAQFEVGPEVAEQFESSFGNRDHILLHPDPAASRAGKAFINLKSALRAQLLALGITRIDTIEGCTASEPARFFSHRRDRGITGRMIGLIGPRA